MKKLLLIVLLAIPYLTKAQTPNPDKQFSGEKTVSFLRFTEKKPKLTEIQGIFRDSLRLSSGNTFTQMRKTDDKIGFSHITYQQYFNKIKVEHGIYSVHGKNNELDYIMGSYLPIKGVKTAPALTSQMALEKTLSHIGAKKYMWQDPGEEALLKRIEKSDNATYYPSPELVIIKDFLLSNSKYRLAYKIKVYAMQPRSNNIYYIDALDGKMLYIETLIKEGNSPGTAQTRYSGSRNITTDSYSGGFRLRESRNGVAIETHNMNLTGNYGGAADFSDNDNNWTSTEHNNSARDNAALDAHWGTEMVYDYFMSNFGRNSWNNNGGSLFNYVHADLIALNYSNNDNAFWDGSKMTYGDGQSNFSPLTSLDVVAHEIGHGINSSTANLAYNKESGAMNEGFSDIWGACVEAFAAPAKQRWLIGEDISLFSDALRSMSNPNAHGQPDTYGGTFWVNTNGCTPTRENDYCGVHTNSGVLNFWFFLLTDGGSGTNDINNAYSVSGIGIGDASQIAYRTLTLNLSNPNSTFADARTASVQAATDLYGATSCQVKAVIDAWYAVGVGGPYSGNLGGVIAGPLALCDNDNIYTIANLPAGATVTNWSLTGVGSEISSISGNQITVTRTDYGYFRIIATVNTTCGTVQVTSEEITAGLPTVIAGIEVSSNGLGSPIGTLCNHDYDHDDYVNTFTYTLNEYPRVPLTLNYYIIDPLIGGFYSHAVTVTNKTGTFSLPENLQPGQYYLEVYVSGGPCAMNSEIFEVNMEYVNCGSSRLVVYPNPASTEFAVSQNGAVNENGTNQKALAGSKSQVQPFDIKLLDGESKILRTVSSKDGSDIKVDVSTIPSGIYFLHINTGGKLLKKQVIVKH